jgi:hypothetical protein
MNEPSRSAECPPEIVLPRNTYVSIAKVVDGQEADQRTGRLFRDLQPKAILYLTDSDTDISWIDPDFVGIASFHTGTIQSIEPQPDGSWHLQTKRNLYVLRALRSASVPKQQTAPRTVPASVSAAVPSLSGQLRGLLGKLGFMKTAGNGQS